ncbi:hypothetical protein BNCALIDO_00026 [Aeromonas phage vB_AdhM_TS9]|nr:hypothetical protein BNCALIDO_00026 [Aeromonas phage vB_AdhM_TS9]
MNKQFTGVIERLFVNDRKTAKGDKKSISIANNKVYYGLGLHDTDTYQVDGVTLKEGMEVSFTYGDGKYKNVVLDTLKIIKTQPNKEVAKAKVDKSLPIRLGNSLTVASHFTNTHIDLVALAKQLLPKIDALQAKLVEKYPAFDDYSRSARCGQCVVMAAQFTKNQDSFIEVAEQLFDELCLAEEELKNPVVKGVKEIKKEEKIEEVQPDIIETSEDVIDWDKDIPF